MGQSDFALVTSSLSTASVARNVGPYFTPPNGGGSNTFYLNSVASASGCVAYYADLAGFTPTGPGSTPTGGGLISCAMRRIPSANNTGFSPFIFLCSQGGPPSVNDTAYIIGLSDANPYRIMIAKTPMVSGLNEEASGFVSLGQSSAQYAMADGIWHHLALAARVQPNGDVLLQAFQNDVDLHGLDSPASFDWQPINGIPTVGINDDNGLVQTGTNPLWGGYMGFGFSVYGGLARRAAFCGLQVKRDV